MQFEAAEEHLRAALASGADAGDPSRRGVDAGALRDRVGRPLGRGRRRRAGVACRGARGRSTPSARSSSASELLMVATVVPRLRRGLAGHLQRLRVSRRAGHPGFEAVAQDPRRPGAALTGSGRPAAAVAEVQAALAAGLPPAAATSAGVPGADDAAARRSATTWRCDMLDVALEGARREGHAARQGAHPRTARGDRAGAGFAPRRRRSRPRRDCCWSTSGTSPCCSSSRSRSTVHIERGALRGGGRARRARRGARDRRGSHLRRRVT